MELVSDSEHWDWFRKHVTSESTRLVLVSAWVTEMVTEVLGLVPDTAEVHLVFRWPKTLDEIGPIDVTAILEANKRKKVTVSFVENLHAKVYMVDQQAVLITSGNLTGAGLGAPTNSPNVELGVTSSDRELARAVSTWFEALPKRTLDAEAIARLREWEKLAAHAKADVAAQLGDMTPPPQPEAPPPLDARAKLFAHLKGIGWLQKEPVPGRAPTIYSLRVDGKARTVRLCTSVHVKGQPDQFDFDLRKEDAYAHMDGREAAVDSLLYCPLTPDGQFDPNHAEPVFVPLNTIINRDFVSKTSLRERLRGNHHRITVLLKTGASPTLTFRRVTRSGGPNKPWTDRSLTLSRRTGGILLPPVQST